MRWALGLDVGGTKIAGGLVSDTGEVRNFQSRMIQAKGDQAVNAILETGRLFIDLAQAQGIRLEGVGIAVPGAVNIHTGIVLGAPNLDWKDLPLKSIAEKQLRLPSEIELDVRATALGEMLSGAAKDIKDFVYITIGTGIGAGIVINGLLLYGSQSTSGEIGHCILIKDGPLCGCGQRGCFEALAAGPAIADRAQRAAWSALSQSILVDAAQRGDEIDAKMVFEAALKGDELALEVVRETADYIGRGLALILNILNPQKIIIGGGVAKAGELLFRSIRSAAAKYTLYPPAKRTEIIPISDPNRILVAGSANLIFTRCHPASHQNSN
jgi:glucokinase